MAHFFPAGSRLDVERPSSYTRRTPSRNVLREGGDDSPAESRLGRPSHINWLQNSLSATQASPPMPKRPPSARLGRSASLSALAAPSPLHRQSSLISNHSLQLDRLAGCRADNPDASSTQPLAKPLSPISERSYVPTPKRELDVEPSTPISVGSTYSAFLRRPLKRSISATSTSSLLTNATSTHPPTLPPLNITPLDIRPVYPSVSHRAGPQLFSTVYEDAASERTGSFVTARSVVGDTEDTEANVGKADAHGPSGSTTLYSSASPPAGGVDPSTDPDRVTDGTPTLTTTPPSGSGSGGDSSSGSQPHARPRPHRNAPASGGSGGGTSDTFIWHRWTKGLSFGSALSRPSFSAAQRACAALARLPPLPMLLFWAGFLAPWCWLIGGWLITEGRWEESGKARAALPLWKSRRGPTAGARGRQGKGGQSKGKAVSGPHDSFAKDLEKSDAVTIEGQASREERGVGPHRHHWVPARWNRARTAAPAPEDPSDGGTQKEKVVTFVKPYSAEVWVYRCRLAAVVSALILLTAFIVTLIVLRGSN
ncbi:hypothetical protein B0F90DRAFT_1818178 [Multifurca ochricompacta]|uniref:Uncharacterized protein n=1 Tax=Multifurca ochricompacta TaxID=376703 RepID=A0AAD4M3V6_9AGAM|nr:hypothetical protein B0F90DRAFT_1818178 [Multifurca ochricompacta]